MKKYLFSALAICLAAGAVAFTAPKSAPIVYFTFTGATTSTTDVEDLTKWSEAAESELCIADNQACQIAIDEDLLVGTPGSRTLNVAAPSLVIDAQDLNGSDSKYEPIYVSGPSFQAFNKQ